MSANDFDVGNIYKRSNNYYLAITNRTVLTYDGKEFLQFTAPKDYFIQVAELSVRELCQSWKISVADFDREKKKYFSPDEEAVERARRSRERGEDDEVDLESLFDIF